MGQVSNIVRYDGRSSPRYGQLDQIVGSKYARRAEVGSERPVGPFLIEGSGHFVQFERARVFNTAVTVFCRDLLVNGLR